MYLVDLETGDIIPLRKSSSFGWSPTWSKDGKAIYIGEKNMIIIAPINFSEESIIKMPEDSWISFLHLNPSGDRLLFVEEGKSTHAALSTVKIDGSGYKRLYLLDLENEFFLDHPTFIDDSNILFLARGENRNFTGDFNKPYVITLWGKLRRMPLECSHYDVNPKKDKILCGQEGYVIDLEGNIIKEIPELHGHGVWAPDGETFLMTGDPVPVPEGSQYFGKIVILNFSSNKTYNLVSHESAYDSSLPIHVQPNAQFSRDGKHIIYESESGHLKNSDIYMVSLK